MINAIIDNLAKIGYGCGLFAIAYVANIILGAWQSVRINGVHFEWARIWQSVVKFITLGLGLAMLSVAVTLVPYYAAYAGLDIGAEVLDAISTIVICGAFLTAAVRYLTDALAKLKAMLA